MTNILSSQELYQKVKATINSADPIKLISGGAPEDEYDGEINKIVGLLQKNLEAESLAEEIHQIFVQSFSAETAGDKSIYNKIAEELLK